jgi:hypothetical protein
VNARLAEIGLAATAAVRGGGRTAMRAAQPGEACFSKNGEQRTVTAAIVYLCSGSYSVICQCAAVLHGHSHEGICTQHPQHCQSLNNGH